MTTSCRGTAPTRARAQTSDRAEFRVAPDGRALATLAIYTVAALIFWVGAVGCWWSLDSAGVPEALGAEVQQR